MREIDLSGPDGNAFALIGMVRTWGKQLGVDTKPVLGEMTSGDYSHLVAVMREWCRQQYIDVTFIEGDDDA